jgi:hypothetical protein
MQDQAHKLAEIVSVFKLDGRPEATASRAKARPGRAVALGRLPA